MRDLRYVSDGYYTTLFSVTVPGERYGWGNWLRRVKYSADIPGSRGITDAACRIEFTAAEREGKQCDEFPFASAEQGASNAKPKNNFSVLPINAPQNNAHGNVLGAWYQNNRVIQSDRFYIHLSD
ncbi:NucA/NucB deoxyribonuclease domain-containing protein [Nonomuraea jiangxiensis]|uniref:NucA/NucB deoxyribonuclease domain-containing protein n=1 Tax=Nonomuraea jiangxiensis TaxID=633440 RepID=UPI0015A4173C|nr:NucA/NucB deoxyribonuclease domain-containing protein [Nonomuraea jiangxiensis]